MISVLSTPSTLLSLYWLSVSHTLIYSKSSLMSSHKPLLVNIPAVVHCWHLGELSTSRKRRSTGQVQAPQKTEEWRWNSTWERINEITKTHKLLDTLDEIILLHYKAVVCYQTAALCIKRASYFNSHLNMLSYTRKILLNVYHRAPKTGCLSI